MSKVLLAVSSFLAVQSATDWKVNPTVLYTSNTSAAPTGITACTDVTWAAGHGGDGAVYATSGTMNVIAIVASPSGGHTACGTALMIRATASDSKDLDTQYLYVKIAATAAASDWAGAAPDDILVGDLSTDEGEVIKAKVTDYLCGATTCVNPTFEVKATALPEGLGYLVGDFTDTECAEPGTDHPDWTFVTSSGLEAISLVDSHDSSNLSKSCNQYYELHSTVDDSYIEVQVTRTVANGGPADGAWAFKLQPDQMKALCGTAAVAEHTNRIPFQCRITSKTATGPPADEETTTTTTTLAPVDTTSTTMKTEEEEDKDSTTTTTTASTTASKTEEESSAFRVGAAAIAAALCVL